MIVFRKKPLPVEAVQFDDTEECLLEILRLQDRKVKSIVSLFSSIYIGGIKVNVGDWVVKEGEHISVYTSDKFEILFKREMPNFATPALADIA